MAGIPIGMQNLLRTSTGGVAFAQPPATSLNPYGIKTDSGKPTSRFSSGVLCRNCVSCETCYGLRELVANLAKSAMQVGGTNGNTIEFV
jgi:hypothetical protein